MSHGQNSKHFKIIKQMCSSIALFILDVDGDNKSLYYKLFRKERGWGSTFRQSDKDRIGTQRVF